MDLDTTIKGFTLTHKAIRKIFTEICAVQIADDVQFEVVDLSDIRETDDYPGIRVALKANYPPISVPLTVDVTTGDMITPREVEYTFSLLFDDRTISILAYNLETVLAAQGAIMAIGLVCSAIGSFYGHIILFDSIALGIAAGECTAINSPQFIRRCAL